MKESSYINENPRYNRIKVVLVEQKRTNLWLAEQMKLNSTTISSWCSNRSQPSLEKLYKIAQLLQVSVSSLLSIPDGMEVRIHDDSPSIRQSK